MYKNFSSSKKLFSKININIAFSVLSIAITLFVIPIYLKNISEIEFGYLSLVWIFAAYHNVFNFGTGISVARMVGSSPKDNALSIFYMGCTLSFRNFLWSSIVLTIFLVFIKLFNRPNFFYEPDLISITLTLTFIFTLIFQSTISNFYQGLNKIFMFSLINFIFTISTSVIPIVIFSAEEITFDKIFYSIALSRFCVCMIFIFIVSLGYKFIVDKDLINKKMNEFRISSNDFGFAGILAAIVSIADRLSILIFHGPKNMGIYYIPFNLTDKFNILSNSFNVVYLPIFSSLSSSKDSFKLNLELRKSFFLVFLVSTICLLIFCLFIELFLNIWLQDLYKEIYMHLSIILIISMYFNSLTRVFYVFLQSNNRGDLIKKFYYLFAPLYVSIMCYVASFKDLYLISYLIIAKTIFELISFYYLCKLIITNVRP